MAWGSRQRLGLHSRQHWLGSRARSRGSRGRPCFQGRLQGLFVGRYRVSVIFLILERDTKVNVRVNIDRDDQEAF